MMIPLLTSLLLSDGVESDTPDFLYFILVDRFDNGDKQNDWFVDSMDPQAFHGGDLQGVTARLDHIERLGADAIWLSPIFEMRTEPFHGHGAFHGYWTENLKQIEESMGGDSALWALAEEMDNRNLSLVLDMVYNHTSFDADMVTEHPDWFHPAKPILNWNDPLELSTHQVHGLPDLNQSNPAVYEYLLKSSLHWLELPSVIGFRIDAIRHLDNEFLGSINTDLPNSWLLGEDFQGNPIANIDRIEQTGIDALFDFPFYYALSHSLCDGQSLEEIASILSLDTHYPKNSTRVRFLDNHDVPRILSRCGEDRQKVLTAELILFAVQGTPMITYGTETWSLGDTEPDNRGDMNWTEVDPIHTQHISTLATFRKHHRVLKEGSAQILHANTDQLIIEQQLGRWTSLLAINRSDIPLTLPQDCTRSVEGFLFTESLHPIQNIPITLHPKQSVLLVCNKRATSTPIVTLTVLIEGTADQAPLLVGSLPSLGGWNPNEGQQSRWNGEHWTTTIELPQNTVAAFKVVYCKDTGFHWDDGGNRFLHSDTDKTFWIR
jgi:glycosidase